MNFLAALALRKHPYGEKNRKVDRRASGASECGFLGAIYDNERDIIGDGLRAGRPCVALMGKFLL